MDSRKQAFVGHFPEADPADAELAEVRMRAAADVAAVIPAHSEFRFLPSFQHQAVLRQIVSSEWAPICHPSPVRAWDHGARVILYRKIRADR